MNDDWGDLIKSRADHFWGYGNLNGDYWFVGMEEGHDLDLESLRNRFEDTRGKSVVDIVDGNPSFAHKLRWFKPPAPPIQRTYKGYIIIKLFLELRRMPTVTEIREFQLTRLGRALVNGQPNDHAILELMPLPATSLSERHWLYKDFGIPDFVTRRKYIAKYKPLQCEKLKQLINQYKPKAVIFYSLTYLQDWQTIVPGTLKEVEDRQFIYQGADTLYCVLPHPVARGITNTQWAVWGAALLERLTSENEKI